MEDDLNDIELDYPRTYSDNAVVRILDEYKLQHPEMYARWENIERHPGAYGDDPLFEISVHGIRFLQKNFCSKSQMGTVGAWSDIRAEMIRRALDHSGEGGNELDR